jgi:hypothetical protein
MALKHNIAYALVCGNVTRAKKMLSELKFATVDPGEGGLLSSAKQYIDRGDFDKAITVLGGINKMRLPTRLSANKLAIHQASMFRPIKIVHGFVVQKPAVVRRLF